METEHEKINWVTYIDLYNIFGFVFEPRIPLKLLVWENSNWTLVQGRDVEKASSIV